MFKKIKILISFTLLPLFCISQNVRIDGALIISKSTESPDPGTIRWTGTDFEGWNGLKWLSLTPGEKVKDASGNSYTKLTIGNQIWLDHNLHTLKYNDGTDIPLASNISEWQAATQAMTKSPIMCWYDDNQEANEFPYGALYTYYAIDTLLNGSKNVCPIGFHVPDTTEFQILKTHLDSMQGGHMKFTGITHWSSPNFGADNSSGFAAFPAGRRGPSGTFAGKSSFNYLRTINGIPSNVNSYYGLLSKDNDMFSIVPWNRGIGMSIRCIGD